MVAKSVSPAPPVAAPTVAAPGLIAGTFQQLQNAAKSGSSTRPETAPRAAGSTSSLVSASPTAPSTRLVSTTVVHADAVGAPGTDGMPIFETAPQPATAQPVAVPLAPLADASPSAAIVTASAQSAPVAQPIAAEPVPLPPPNRAAAPARTSTAVASAGGGAVSVVNGGGVTVRSGPSKSRSQLFALGPGQKVTVQSTEKGWLQIVDAKGRRGWAYSSYFSKQ